MGVRALSLALALSAVLAGAEAEAKPRVDWERGLVIATAAAPADLRAPTTELARVKAERVAWARCETKLRAAAGALPGFAKSEVSLDGADVGFIELSSDQGSDGSVVVEMALPIDRLRTLRFGPDAPRPKPGTALPLIVNAQASAVRPQVGLGVKHGDVVHRRPTLFVPTLEAAKARAGTSPAVVATSVKQGAIALPASADVDVAEAPLVIVVYSKKK